MESECLSSLVRLELARDNKDTGRWTLRNRKKGEWAKGGW